ncbi:MAG TPA: hypothetical protein VIV59_02930, partial [Anaeromyxobacteraceae bacterium]
DKLRTPSEVWYCRLKGLTCPAFRVPPSAGNQFTPAVAGDVLVYVDEGQYGVRKGNVVRMSITQGYSAPVSPVNAAQRRPAVSEQLVAWEDDRDAVTGTDIWVHDNLLGGEWSIALPGIQRMPRASGTRVSYLDDAAGDVKVYDLTTGKITVAFPALAGTAVFADVDGTAVVVETLAGDVEVWPTDVRSTNGRPLAALGLRGQQSNPHISGDWVAFEDVSTLARRVMVWNWKTGDLFAPPAGTSSQTLNDISWPRVVYVDDRNKATGADIYLYDTSAVGGADGGGHGCKDGGGDADDHGGGHGCRGEGGDGDDDGDGHGCKDGGEDRDDDRDGHGCKDRGEDRDDDGDGRGCKDGGAGGGSPRGCDDARAVPMAELRVVRERSGPDAINLEFTAEAEVPVLACMDASDVSSAWVLLDDEAVARPNEFNQHVVHLERRRSVAAGPNRLGAIIAGKPGAWLSVKLLPDPAGGPAPVAGAALKTPTPGAASLQAQPGPAQGCSGGAAGLAAALPLGAWMLRRRRPRR